jgi:hypothetical protein
VPLRQQSLRNGILVDAWRGDAVGAAELKVPAIFAERNGDGSADFAACVVFCEDLILF